MTAYSEKAILQALALVQEIEGQSDRGAAIVGAAWVEEELQSAIESFVVKDKPAWDRLFRKSGPLATFSAKIDLARILGMISGVIASDLHIIRDVRNEFAHSVLDKEKQVLSFNTPRIKDKCLALRCVAHEQIAEPRVSYVRACATLNSDFAIHKMIVSDIVVQNQIQAHIEGA